MIYDIIIPEINFDHLEKLRKERDSLRPVDSEMIIKIEKKISLDWTYHSNNIEGNTLTYWETELFLNKGMTSKGKNLNEYLEIKNHDMAIETLKEYLKGEREFTEWLIKEFHAMLFKGNETVKQMNEQGQYIEVNVLPWQYKKEHNYVLLRDWTKKWYEDPLQVWPRMEQLIRYYNEKKNSIHPVILASIIHAEFVNIHPFVDGNWRTARIIMNLILMKNWYLPAVIKTEEKDSYFDALSLFDQSGDIDSFVEEIEKAEIQTLELVLWAVKNQVVVDQADINKVIKNFWEKMKALDKSIGKISKKISNEEKEVEIQKTRDYIFDYVSKTITNQDLFDITLENNFNLRDLKLRNILHNWIKQHNLYLENEILFSWWDFYKDFLTQWGSCVFISLKWKRSYIPSFSMYFMCLPSKYTLSIWSYIVWTKLNSEGTELIDNKPTFSCISNGILFEDWNKEDIKNFVNENISLFFKLVETEAENRRASMEA